MRTFYTMAGGFALGAASLAVLILAFHSPCNTCSDANEPESPIISTVALSTTFPFDSEISKTISVDIDEAAQVNSITPKIILEPAMVDRPTDGPLKEGETSRILRLTKTIAPNDLADAVYSNQILMEVGNGLLSIEPLNVESSNDQFFQARVVETIWGYKGTLSINQGRLHLKLSKSGNSIEIVPLSAARYPSSEGLHVAHFKSNSASESPNVGNGTEPDQSSRANLNPSRLSYDQYKELSRWCYLPQPLDKFDAATPTANYIDVSDVLSDPQSIWKDENNASEATMLRVAILNLNETDPAPTASEEFFRDFVALNDIGSGYQPMMWLSTDENFLSEQLAQHGYQNSDIAVSEEWADILVQELVNHHMELSKANSEGADSKSNLAYEFQTTDPIGRFLVDIRNRLQTHILVLIVPSEAMGDACGRSLDIGLGANHSFAMIDKNCIQNGTTLSHEVAHILGGRHEFSKDPKSLTYSQGAWRFPNFFFATEPIAIDKRENARSRDQGYTKDEIWIGTVTASNVGYRIPLLSGTEVDCFDGTSPSIIGPPSLGNSAALSTIFSQPWNLKPSILKTPVKRTGRNHSCLVRPPTPVCKDPSSGSSDWRISYAIGSDTPTNAPDFFDRATRIVNLVQAGGQTIVVDVFTDSSGSTERNRSLSLDRANMIRGYLKQKLNNAGKFDVRVEVCPYGEYFSACPSVEGLEAPSPPADRLRRAEISVIRNEHPWL